MYVGNSRRLLPWLLFGAVVFLSAPVMGEETPEPVNLGVMDSISQSFEEEAATWLPAMQDMARNLLLMLVAFSLFYQAVKTSFSDAKWKDFFAFMVMQCLTVGFFMTCINFVDTWAFAIIDSFTAIPDRAMAGSELMAGVGSFEPSPSRVVSAGWNIANRYMEACSIMDPGSSLVFAAAALCIIIIYAVIGAWIMLVQIEGYVVIAAGVILLGFGGMHWTEDTAKRYLFYVVGFGAKLFGVYLIVALGTQLTENWINPQVNDALVKSTGSMAGTVPFAVGIPVVVLMLVAMIPSVLERLASGMSSASAFALNSMLTTTLMQVSSIMKGAALGSATGAMTLKTALKGGAGMMGAGSIGEALSQKGGVAQLAQNTGKILGEAGVGRVMTPKKGSFGADVARVVSGSGSESDADG